MEWTLRIKNVETWKIYVVEKKERKKERDCSGWELKRKKEKGKGEEENNKGLL